MKPEPYDKMMDDKATEEVKMPKYDIEVELTGSDGNAFSILGKVARALRRSGATDDEVKAFNTEATSGDYDKLLQVCMAWVNVV